MKLSDSPTSNDYTHKSNSPGSGDKIGFNDPTPGMWYILLDTEMVFGDVTITASLKIDMFGNMMETQFSYSMRRNFWY